MIWLELCTLSLKRIYKPHDYKKSTAQIQRNEAINVLLQNEISS